MIRYYGQIPTFLIQKLEIGINNEDSESSICVKGIIVKTIQQILVIGGQW